MKKTLFLLIITLLSYHFLKLTANSNYHSPETFAKKINQVLPEPHSSLLSGMVFGTKSQIPQHFYQNLKTTGTLHIIVLSGYNISLILAAVFALFIPLFGRKIASLIALFSVFLFILFVGPSPPVIRAAIMGGLTLLSLYFGRPKKGLYLLFLTALIMLLFDKSLISSLSFQLSFAATFGIILFAHPSKQKTTSLFKTILKGFKEELLVTLSAQVFTTPLILYSFGTLSLISPLTNALIAWTVPIITPLGLIASLFLLFLPLIGKVLLFFSYSFLTFFIFIINLTARFPFAQIKFDKISPFFYLIYFLIIFAVLIVKYKRIKIQFLKGSSHPSLSLKEPERVISQKIRLPAQFLFILFLLFFSLSILFFTFLAFNFNKKPAIIFCDVGQGDAILIKTSQNHKVLIDGGPDNKVLTCLSKNIPFYDRKIDFLVITHPQKDHLTGAISVIERYNVTYLLVQNQAVDSSQFLQFQDLVFQKKPIIINPQKGDQIKIDNLTLSFLWPEKSIGDKSLWQKKISSSSSLFSASIYPGLDPNDLSIVFLVSKKNFDILLTGDISNYILDTIRQDILKYTRDQKLEVFKFPHHGSRTALSTAFLYQFKPETTVISVGKNRFGHPHKEVIKALNSINSRILRTDKSSTIKLPL